MKNLEKYFLNFKIIFYDTSPNSLTDRDALKSTIKLKAQNKEYNLYDSARFADFLNSKNVRSTDDVEKKLPQPFFFTYENRQSNPPEFSNVEELFSEMEKEEENVVHTVPVLFQRDGKNSKRTSILSVYECLIDNYNENTKLLIFHDFEKRFVFISTKVIDGGFDAYKVIIDNDEHSAQKTYQSLDDVVFFLQSYFKQTQKKKPKKRSEMQGRKEQLFFATTLKEREAPDLLKNYKQIIENRINLENNRAVEGVKHFEIVTENGAITNVFNTYVY